MRVATFSAVFCALVAIAVGCGGGSSANEGEPAGPAQPPAEVALAEAVAAVREFDAADLDASIDRLNAASFADAAAVDELAPFLTDADPVRRWAALYLSALLVDAERADLLRAALDDDDPALQVMAAGALARLGVVESLPVLVEGLGSDAELPYDDPPRPLADLALEALVAYTGESFATQAEWQAWWDEVGGSLTWNGERYVAG